MLRFFKEWCRKKMDQTFTHFVNNLYPDDPDSPIAEDHRLKDNPHKKVKIKGKYRIGFYETASNLASQEEAEQQHELVKSRPHVQIRVTRNSSK